jgi:hypothetical protein
MDTMRQSVPRRLSYHKDLFFTETDDTRLIAWQFDRLVNSAIAGIVGALVVQTRPAIVVSTGTAVQRGTLHEWTPCGFDIVNECGRQRKTCSLHLSDRLHEHVAVIVNGWPQQV